MNEATQSILDKLSRWLTEEEYSIKEESHPDLHWLLIAAGGLAPLQIGQQTHDRVDIQIEFKIGNPEKFSELPEGKQNRYLKQIFLSLISLGLQSNGLQQNLDGLLISSSLFLDALTKDYFMSHIRNVLNGAALVRMILADAQAEITTALDTNEDPSIH